jgi:hypothetical protein
MNRLRQATALLLGPMLLASCQSGAATAPTTLVPDTASPTLSANTLVAGTADDLDDALTRVLPVLAALPGAPALTRHLEAGREAAARGQGVRLQQQLELARAALDHVSRAASPDLAADVDAIRLLLEALL